MIKKNWENGTFKDITLEPSHDRLVICSDMNKNIIVTGSADHGLRVFDISGNFKRELFTKTYGHREMVTSCKILNDNRIVSSGMDGVICLWDKSVKKCEYLKGHEASISKLLIDDNNICFSCSYDCTIRLWDLDNKKHTSIFEGPHKNAILDMIWKNSLLVSGDKNGKVALWDINTNTPFLEINPNKTQISCLSFYDDNSGNNSLILVGGKDGILTCIDMRINKPIFSNKIHGGIINKIKQNDSNFIWSCSSDGSCSILDPINSFKLYNRLKCDSSVFSLECYKKFLVAGLENSSIYCFDLDNCECIWGFGVLEKGGVDNLIVSKDGSNLLCTGEHPKSLLIKF